MINLVKLNNIHKNEKVIILGCGNSINKIKDFDISNIKTIGVNDIGRIYHPDYLLVVDNPLRFPGIRGEVIRYTKSKYVISQINNWQNFLKDRTKFVKFNLGDRNKLTNLSMDPCDTLDYSNNSPYIAIILAYKMGFTKIGLLGIDFTDNHFYAEDGKHNLTKAGKNDVIIKQYDILYQALKSKNIEIYNLSDNSILTNIPFKKLIEF